MASSIQPTAGGSLTQDSLALDDDRTGQAVIQAMKKLQNILHKYMPLRREPGKHVFLGIELVIEDQEEKPFNMIGYILMAAQIIGKWENVIGEEHKARIRKQFLKIVMYGLDKFSRRAQSVTVHAGYAY